MTEALEDELLACYERFPRLTLDRMRRDLGWPRRRLEHALDGARGRRADRLRAAKRLADIVAPPAQTAAFADQLLLEFRARERTAALLEAT